MIPPSPIILRNCRPIYRFGLLVLKIGLIIALGGLVAALLGKGWKIGALGLGCAGLGIVIGQTAEICLTNKMKRLVESVTAKQVHDFAVQHLRATKDGADDTEVFLGKFIGEMDWQERQRRKQSGRR